MTGIDLLVLLADSPQFTEGDLSAWLFWTPGHDRTEQTLVCSSITDGKMGKNSPKSTVSHGYMYIQTMGSVILMVCKVKSH